MGKAKAKAEGVEYVEEPEEKEEEEPEEVEEEPEEPKEVEEPDEPEVEEDPPTVSLTAEEKAVKFRTMKVPEISDYALSLNFTKFTLPTKDEGFDEIKFEWNKGPKCEEHLKTWILTKKQTTRMEDLKPSAWFADQYSKFHKEFKEWQSKNATIKAAKAKKASDKRK